jgi:hypothetical protein
MKKISTFIAFVAILIGLAINAQAQVHRTMTLLSGGSITAGENSTTNLAASTRVDVPLWVNTDGSYPTVPVMITAVGTNALATNTVTLTFASLPDGTNELATTTVAVLMTGTTKKVAVTNISSALVLTGVNKLKLKTVAVNDTTDNMGGHVITVNVLGFVP